MAVGKLSGVWVRQVLTELYPDGVVRRALLDHFAALLVSKRSSRGAKGRLAKRLYGTLLKLQKRGLIRQDAGIVRAMAVPSKTRDLDSPTLGVLLERLLFKAMLAEDGQGDGHTPLALREARWAFLAAAIESGWTVPQAATGLGIPAEEASRLLR